MASPQKKSPKSQVSITSFFKKTPKSKADVIRSARKNSPTESTSEKTSDKENVSSVNTKSDQAVKSSNVVIDLVSEKDTLDDTDTVKSKPLNPTEKDVPITKQPVESEPSTITSPLPPPVNKTCKKDTPPPSVPKATTLPVAKTSPVTTNVVVVDKSDLVADSDHPAESTATPSELVTSTEATTSTSTSSSTAAKDKSKSPATVNPPPVELSAEAKEKVSIYEARLAVLQSEKEVSLCTQDIFFKNDADIQSFHRDKSDLITLFALYLQGSTKNLSELSNQMLSVISSSLSTTTEWSVVLIEMEFKKLAERVAYGPKASRSVDPFLDKSPQSLWVWEVAAVENYVTSNEHLKLIKEMRTSRKRIGNFIKSLSRAVTLLKSPESTDNSRKLSLVEVKISKFERDAKAAQQRALLKEKKERERLEAKDLREKKEKERLEAKQLKEELIKQRQLEREAEKARKKQERLAEKAEEKKAALEERERKKCKSQSLLSFFSKRKDESSNSAAASASGTSASSPIRLDNSTSSSTNTNVSSSAAAAVSPSESMANKIAALDKLLASEFSVKSLILQRRVRACSILRGPASKRKARSLKKGSGSVIEGMKLLQFHTDYRPPYYGTHGSTPRFKKQGLRACGNGRRPLGHVPTLDYDRDSDEEWEEEEPGESLSGAEADPDEDNGDDELDYEDNWLAFENEIEYTDDNTSEGKTLNGVKCNNNSSMKKEGSKMKSIETLVEGPYLMDRQESQYELTPAMAAYRVEVLWKLPPKIVDEENESSVMQVVADTLEAQSDKSSSLTTPKGKVLVPAVKKTPTITKVTPITTFFKKATTTSTTDDEDTKETCDSSTAPSLAAKFEAAAK